MGKLLFLTLISIVALGRADLSKEEKYPATCLEAKERGKTSGSEILYDPPYDYQVYCDQLTDKGGWLVFQRRDSDSVDFRRNWEEYERGFGSPTGTFWIGLTTLNQMMSKRRYKLRIDLRDYDGNSVYAIYEYFSISGPLENYTLRVGGYRGTSGDSLTSHSNLQFSTADRDHDTWRGNCAALRRGGWWYGHCLNSDLNGSYKKNPEDRPDGVVWYHWKKNFQSLKRSEMKMKEWI